MRFFWLQKMVEIKVVYSLNIVTSCLLYCQKQAETNHKSFNKQLLLTISDKYPDLSQSAKQVYQTAVNLITTST